MSIRRPAVEERPVEDLFQTRLESQIELRHRLVRLAQQMLWTALEQALSRCLPADPVCGEPLEPLVGHPHAHASGVGGFLGAQAVNEDAVYEQGSTAWRQPGMFMQVHPRLLGLGLLRNPHLPEMPRMHLRMINDWEQTGIVQGDPAHALRYCRDTVRSEAAIP